MYAETLFLLIGLLAPIFIIMLVGVLLCDAVEWWLYHRKEK